MEQLVSNPAIEEYCRGKWMSENIDFLKAMFSFRRAINPNAALIRILNQTYIMPNAPKFINISNAIQAQILADNNPTYDTYKPAIEQVVGMLNGTQDIRGMPL